MFGAPLRWRVVSRSAAAILTFSMLAGCAAFDQTAMTDDPGRGSVDSLEQMIRNNAVADLQGSNTNISQAWDAVDARDCQRAMPIAIAVLQGTSDDLDARLVQAECAAMANDRAMAGQHYEQILNEEREPRALRGLGVLRAREGRYVEAQDLLLEASLAAPEDWRTWNAMGFVSDVDGDWENAAEAYRRAASLVPENATPLNNLGLSYLQQGDTEAAINAFNQAINRDPSFVAADENLRMALIFDGQLDNALWGLSDERRPMILNNAGVVARSRGELEFAATLFQRALDESPVFYERAYRNLRALEEMESPAE